MIPEKLTKIQWQRFLAGTSPPDTDYGKFCQEVFNRYNAHEGLETILGSANSDVKRLSEYCDKLKKIVEGLLEIVRQLRSLDTIIHPDFLEKMEAAIQQAEANNT